MKPTRPIASLILDLRGRRVLIDADLAELYGVATKVLNQAIGRNANRFPADFAFQLTAKEKMEVVTNCDHLARLKFSPNLPRAFTERGAIMAATVLNSPQAVAMSVYVVRAFSRSVNPDACSRVDAFKVSIRRLERPAPASWRRVPAAV